MSAKKYLRTIQNASGKSSIEVDVYCVLKAFNVTCPALAHALKKLLCPGCRGEKDYFQDLLESKEAIDRALDMAAFEESNPTEK